MLVHCGGGGRFFISRKTILNTWAAFESTVATGFEVPGSAPGERRERRKALSSGIFWRCISLWKLPGLCLPRLPLSAPKLESALHGWCTDIPSLKAGGTLVWPRGARALLRADWLFQEVAARLSSQAAHQDSGGWAPGSNERRASRGWPGRGDSERLPSKCWVSMDRDDGQRYPNQKGTGSSPLPQMQPGGFSFLASNTFGQCPGTAPAAETPSSTTKASPRYK